MKTGYKAIDNNLIHLTNWFLISLLFIEKLLHGISSLPAIESIEGNTKRPFKFIVYYSTLSLQSNRANDVFCAVRR